DHAGRADRDGVRAVLAVELLREFTGVHADVAEVDAETLLVLGADRMIEQLALAGPPRHHAEHPLGVVLARELVGEIFWILLVFLIAHTAPPVFLRTSPRDHSRGDPGATPPGGLRASAFL